MGADVYPPPGKIKYAYAVSCARAQTVPEIWLFIMHFFQRLWGACLKL